MDAALLGLLACPACKKSLEQAGSFLACRFCKKKYPVENGVPVLLVDQALAL